MRFEIICEIRETKIIAAGASVHDIRRLRRIYGGRRWRKLKGIAMVRLPDGANWQAEVHSYEAHGIGRRDLKIKCLL